MQTAHVVVRAQRSGPRLVAYVGTGGADLPVGEVRNMLSGRLPRYLVPHHIVVLDELPLTSHGKVDERALAAVGGISDTEGGHGARPRPKVLAEVVGELLETTAVDVTADLLALGLDSIVALSVVQAARRRRLSLRARLMLECGSIRELAAAVDAESLLDASPEDAQERGPIPVLPNVHWLHQHGSPRRLAQTEAIRLPHGTTGEQLRASLAAIVDGHEILRSRLDLDTMCFVPHEPAEILEEVTVTGDPSRPPPSTPVAAWKALTRNRAGCWPRCGCVIPTAPVCCC